jgi:tetratricopeptide (TPR) repeat protein
LAGLGVEQLSDDQLEQAYQTAQKLDAQDLAANFARTLVARPPRPGRADRFPWYSHLVQRALSEGRSDEALEVLNQAQSFDTAHNEGRRQNDYELRRGQVHAKRSEAEQAHDVFQRLIERDPSNLRYRGDATEEMLSLKQGKWALHFAEQGLAAARKQNNRDQEHYFLELAAAAKKQGA